MGRQVKKEYPEYRWRPDQLIPVVRSTEVATVILLKKLRPIRSNPKSFNDTLISFLSSTFGLSITDNELKQIIDLIQTILDSQIPSASHEGKVDEEETGFNPSTNDQHFLPLQYALSDLISKQAEVGWTTHGHTGVDVNFYLYTGTPSSTSSPMMVKRAYPPSFLHLKDANDTSIYDDEYGVREMRKRDIPFLPPRPVREYPLPVILNKSFLQPPPDFHSPETWPNAQSNNDKNSVPLDGSMMRSGSSIENVDVGQLIVNYLGLDLDAITRKLRP